jgi:hypothetical protein
MITKTTAILALMPTAEFTIVNDNEVTWINPSKAPFTDEEINAKQSELLAQAPLEAIKKSRRIAYTNEADPLFFKSQRGDGTLEEWQEKINEIKLRYPYPTV